MQITCRVIESDSRLTILIPLPLLSSGTDVDLALPIVELLSLCRVAFLVETMRKVVTDER